MEIYIITKNKGKLMAAQDAFSKFNIELKQFDKDVHEIQADTSAEIALFTAKSVAKEFNINVIREDHSIFINGLSSFPGPYTSYFEKHISAEKILEMLKNQNDKTGYFEIAAAFAKPDGSVKEFVFRVPIKISDEVKGNLSGGWNRIIILNNEKTLAEYDEKERVNVWNRNFIEIAKFLIVGE